MSFLLSDEMKSQTIKVDELFDINETSVKTSIDYSEELKTLFENWLKLTDEEPLKSIDSRFDQLIKIGKQNISLEAEIESKQENTVKDVLTKCDTDINGKSAEDLTHNDLINHLKECESCVESLKSDLKSRKELKSELSNKTQLVLKNIDELKCRQNELKKLNNDNKINECKTLTTAMRVMYKTWTNSRVVGLVFNDEENLERLIVVDKENKSEHEIAEEFWNSLNQDYNI